MDYQMMIAPMVILILIVIGFILNELFHFKEMFIRRYLDEDPEKALVHVWNGRRWDPVKGWKVYEDIFGANFHYYYKRIEHEVRTGSKYPVMFEDRRRVIYARTESLYALPFPVPGDQSNEPQFTEQAIGLNTLGMICAELDKSMQGKSGFSTKMLLIMAGVVLAVGAIVWFIAGHFNQPTTVTPSTNTPAATSKPTVTPSPGSRTPIPTLVPHSMQSIVEGFKNG